jgi:hypothetical protein
VKTRATKPLLEPAQTRELLYSKRYLAADRAKVPVSEIETWDRYLLREHRLLVPVDVQALYVPEGHAEPMLRLPMLLAGANGVVASTAEEGMPPLFADGQPRPGGVHLHWAMPDALLRGRLTETTDANRLGLPALPDRWLVLRIVLPKGGSNVITTAWVLEADRAVAVPLGSWTEGGAASTAATPVGSALAREALVGTAGGGITWSGAYDAVLNRFAFHDPLGDLKTLVPGGADEECASYTVAGWWSDPRLDPLDAARSDDSFDELLARLRWHPLHEWGSEAGELARQYEEFKLKQALGLTTDDAWMSKRPTPFSKPATPLAAERAAALNSSAIYTPADKSLVQTQAKGVASIFSGDAALHVAARPWQLRSSLLHGTVYGVPVAGAVLKDRRPAASDLQVAFGLHDDDLVSALAAHGATPDQLRATERLVSAFTTQRINRLASPDGAVELEEYEHAAGYASLPAGSAGNDRYLQRVQTGGVGGLNLGREGQVKSVVGDKSQFAKPVKAPAMRHAHPMAAAQPATTARAPFASDKASLIFASGGKPTLIKASVAAINDVAHSRVGDVLAPTEARVVDRPAPRWTFPTDPLVGIRGAARSLRHGGDGRASADNQLSCRWPTHVIQELPGLIASDRFIPSLGHGGIPSEALRLAREAVLHDPYHDEWVSAAVTPAGRDPKVTLNRLRAETLLRFGVDGTYDGATAAFDPRLPRSAAARRHMAPMRAQPGVQEQQRLVADEVRKFSLYAGADPDPVGVTTWAQPWVPMWLEWQVQLEGIDPPTLAAWKLDAIDLEAVSTSITGSTIVFSGRSPVSTGAATTLSAAINDWLKAEDALDAIDAGLVDEGTEDAYRELDASVKQLDLVSTALDGVRAQLLGFAATEGLRRPSDGAGGTRNPAPVAAQRALVAGAMSLLRARLIDAFGRVLEVPETALQDPCTPSRTILDFRPQSLGYAPRLLRPARWLLRWVEAGTPLGAEGVEARVDQVELPLTVNPVAGFLLPDHLDESLEVFSIDGGPVGELLHEATSGGVVWEIAAGRVGPADAGPHHDLAPAQAALANFAAGLIAADAAARAGQPLAQAEPTESALTALLRAIDTTLWTVDTFSALGAEHVAGLVGRPVAVVRAQLRLELMPPTDVDLSDPARAADWAQAEDEAKRHAFEVRIGELTRSDDGVLGFFVNDDYARFRLVDKVIAATSADAGRSRGKLELLGANTGKPKKSDIDHPYIAGRDEDDTLSLHIGQTVTLTILMHPGGKCCLTSGILPRKALGLARDWVGPGLAKIAPSLRTGPVLVETDLDPVGQVRLPKVSVFGKNQNFLWRDTPATWRTDAILAATQTALLPDTPAELREGWIRVAPDGPDAAGGEGQA